MCQPTVCKKCAKTTWKGCGMHVAQVMANVPKDLQCPGHDGEKTADAVKPSALAGGGLMKWLRGEK